MLLLGAFPVVYSDWEAGLQESSALDLSDAHCSKRLKDDSFLHWFAQNACCLFHSNPDGTVRLVKPHRHALLLLELETMRRVQEIDRQLFMLIQADYDAARISPQQFLPKQKAFLGTVCAAKNQISLLDGTGKLLPQFPLEGTTAFSIVDLLGDGKPVVLVGNGASVVAYSLE